LNLTFIGDARNNAASSLMVASSKLGVNFTACGPKELWPSEELVNTCKQIALKNGCTITITDNLQQGANNADVIYADVFLSMGEPEEKWAQRIELLKSYQVSKSVMQMAKPTAVFMHALPSFHNINTTIGKQIYDKFGLPEMEVTDEVFESSQSIVFDEAENRMHTIKAVLYATMSDGKEMEEIL
jgi:ornithine carbamoyltransferase